MNSFDRPHRLLLLPFRWYYFNAVDGQAAMSLPLPASVLSFEVAQETIWMLFVRGCWRLLLSALPPTVFQMGLASAYGFARRGGYVAERCDAGRRRGATHNRNTSMEICREIA